MSETRGKIIILVAPSGGGKSTMAQRLLKEFDKLRFSTSATTRDPRPGEVDGRDYYFLSDKEFTKKIENKDFLEWEEFFNGTRYGTLRSDVENQLDKGYFVLLDIEVLGATSVKSLYGEDALAIFLKPPSFEILRERLRNRGTESGERLKQRIERAKEELRYADRFDRVVVNDDLETAYSKLKKLVQSFMNTHS
ncbi:MAG: guanylate kinase [Balneolaceae bacterium]